MSSRGCQFWPFRIFSRPRPDLARCAIDEPPMTSPTPRFQYDFGRNFAEARFFPPPQRTRNGWRPDRFRREWPFRSGNGRTPDCGAIDLMTPVAIHPSPVTDEIPRIPHQFRTSGSFQEITGCRLQGGGYKGVPKIRFAISTRSPEYRYRYSCTHPIQPWSSSRGNGTDSVARASPASLPRDRSI